MAANGDSDPSPVALECTDSADGQSSSSSWRAAASPQAAVSSSPPRLPPEFPRTETPEPIPRLPGEESGTTHDGSGSCVPCGRGDSGSTRRKRKSYSVSEKLALVSAVESGRKKVDICREYGISASTLSSITKNKDSIVGAYEESRLEAKRLRKAAREDLDRALLCWYHQAVACGTPISGPLLQAKAEQIAAELGYEDCSVANAWVERFKRRHSLTYARERGKSGAHSEAGDADAWLATAWPQIRSGHEPWDIFSAIETGLFFRALPKESAQLSDCRCEQGQLAHDRSVSGEE